MSGYHDVVRVSFSHAGSDGSDASLGDQLHPNLRFRIDLLEVVDKLRDVLDTVNVVMRRRTDQRHPDLRMAQARDQLGHFGCRQLSAFAGLGTLSDLDLV